MPASALLGRDAELRSLHQLLDDSRTSGWCHVLVGEPGIGRSTLLNAGRQAASDRGFRVLCAEGSREERLLPYAGVHQLLLPLLTEPSARAKPPLTDPYAVAVAAVDLVLDASRARPVLLVVDDLQWVDEESAAVLAFLGRRLSAHRVGLLAAWRSDYPDNGPRWQLPTSALIGLDEDASAALVDRADATLSATRRLRVLAQSRGNPLALKEFARGFDSSADPSQGPLPNPIRPTRALVDAFSPGLQGLPPRTRIALVVAALDESLVVDDVATTVSRLDECDLDPEVLQPAAVMGLVEVTRGRITFAHPVLHSVVFHSIDDRGRAEMHRAIAYVDGTSGRRAWHLAASATGADPNASAALAAVADRARDRGDLPTACAALIRSAELKPDDAARATLLITVAEIGSDLGHLELIDHALAALDAMTLSPIDQRQVELLRLGVTLTRRTDPLAVQEVVATARRGGRGVPVERRLELLLSAAARCWRPATDIVSRSAIASAAKYICPDPSDPRRLAILAVTAPLTHGSQVLAQLSRLPLSHPVQPSEAALLGQAAYLAGDPALARSYLAVAAAGLRQAGRLAPLARVLGMDAQAAVELGCWTDALVFARECSVLAERTHQPTVLAQGEALHGIVAAVRADGEPALNLLGRSERAAVDCGQSGLVALVQLGRAIAALSASRFDEAWTHLHQLWETHDEMSRRILLGAIGYVADAAHRCGDDPNAIAVLADLQVTAEATAAPGFRIGATYAAAVAGPDESADHLFDRALAQCTPLAAFDRARIHLARGLRLRRERRVAASRVPLREALVAFERLGTTAWADQARNELRATGERTIRRGTGPVETLSAQELQIIRLAAAGVTNREIGQRLCLSHRTIGSHLYRAFPKLGIASRSELRDLLPQLEGMPEPLAC